MEIVRHGDAQFDFISVDCEGLRADSIGVVRVSGGGPIWWIVSDEYTEMWVAEGGEEPIGASAELGREMVGAFRAVAGGRTLSRITYGEVPTGFRQIIPEQGSPPSLERGVRYALHFMGSDMATFEFDF
jgi:hypothetical protein